MTATLAVSDTADGRRLLALSGRLDATTIRRVWDEGRRAISAAPGQRVLVDATNVDYCDGAGAALLVDLMQQRKPGDVQVANLKPAFEALLEQFDVRALAQDLDPPAPRRPAVEEIGVITAGMGADLRQQIVFIGETAAALLYALRHPGTVRWLSLIHI